MGREIEIKLRLSDPEQLRARLSTLHAARVDYVAEVNRIFDTPDRRLLELDHGLRVRQWHSLDKRGEGGATLAFKGPREGGDLKAREEVETNVADADAAVTILQRLGFIEVITYEKRRETWRLGECEVTIDELPCLGWFAEIEGPTAAAVESARDQLDLTGSPPIRETYVHLAATHGDVNPAGVRTLAFDA